MIYGHRNDVAGMAKALEEADKYVGDILLRLQPGDLLVITADHGGDPTTPSTDHSREYVPLLLYGPGLKTGVNLGVRKSFADLGATIYQLLAGKKWTYGESFADMLGGEGA